MHHTEKTRSTSAESTDLEDRSCPKCLSLNGTRVDAGAWIERLPSDPLIRLLRRGAVLSLGFGWLALSVGTGVWAVKVLAYRASLGAPPAQAAADLHAALLCWPAIVAVMGATLWSVDLRQRTPPVSRRAPVDGRSDAVVGWRLLVVVMGYLIAVLLTAA